MIEVSIVIPTYQREEVLIQTIEHMVALCKDRAEILVVDQTPQHQLAVAERLSQANSDGLIRWIKLSPPSITHAMNTGAAMANGDVLLFVDDDIVPGDQLLNAHMTAHTSRPCRLIAGRVLQPWHEDEHSSETFTSRRAGPVTEFIGCNFSISKELLTKTGGFDENFKGAAYRYEREFADRLLESGHAIWYEPSALIRHLHHSTGGTRSKGDHLTSWNPRHPVGAYYYLFVSPRVQWRLVKAARRFFSSVMTLHHLKAPWFIPVTLVSELSGLFWAIWLRLRGPTLPFEADRKTVTRA